MKLTPGPVTTSCLRFLYCNPFWRDGCGCGATDSAEDYGTSDPWFDSQQWYNSWKALEIQFMEGIGNPYLPSFSHHFHCKKYLCNLRIWINNLLFIIYYLVSEVSHLKMRLNLWVNGMWHNEDTNIWIFYRHFLISFASECSTSDCQNKTFGPVL